MIQRDPDDVRMLVKKIEPSVKRGWLDKGYSSALDSVYKSILHTAEKYGTLKKLDLDARHELLTHLAQLLDQWTIEEVLAKKVGKVDSVQERFAEGVWLLKQQVVKEWKDFQGHPSTGRLEVEHKPEPSADPELSKQLDDVEKPLKITGGVFNQDSFIDTIDGVSGTTPVAAGVYCEVLYDRSKGGKSVKVRPLRDPTSANYELFPEGFVPEDHLTLTKRTAPAPGLKYGQAFHHPLFVSVPPALEELNQGGIGDCYLMAAVASVLAKSPMTLVGMMKDHLDGTVSVRLWDIDVKDKQTSFRPKIVRVLKTTATKEDGSDAFATGPLWVKMLEKAYVAAGFQGATTDTLPGKTSYGTIAGGFGEIALQHLLGSRASRIEVFTTKEEAYRDGNWAGLVNRLLKKVGQKEQLALLDPLSGGFEEYQELKKEIDKLHQENTEVRIEDVQKVIPKYKRWGPVFLQFIEEHKIYPGKRMTGKYASGQLEVFAYIKAGLAKQEILTAGTKKKVVSKPTGEFGHSAGETMGKGLVGSHEYTITDKLEKEDGTKFIKLRNPWGSYGRKYTKKLFGGIQAMPDRQQAEFWLELSDFTKRFSDVSHKQQDSGKLETTEQPEIVLTPEVEQMIEAMGVDFAEFLLGKDSGGWAKKYKELARQYHPDKGGDTQQFQNLQSAYEILGKLSRGEPLSGVGGVLAITYQ